LPNKPLKNFSIVLIYAIDLPMILVSFVDDAQTKAVSPRKVIEPIGRNLNAFLCQFLSDAI
jgi:uncharacterized protein involved in outer membrane biogenesis